MPRGKKKSPRKSRPNSYPGRVNDPTGRSSNRAPRGGSYDRTFYQAPVSMGSVIRNRYGGLPDMQNMHINYLAGVVQSGNGTLGTAGNVYCTDPTSTKNICSLVPIAPPDALLGQSYVADLFKHFARQVYKDIKLSYNPFLTGANTSSTNPVSVTIAPYRGGDVTVVSKTDTTAAPFKYADVSGMQDSQTIPSWLPAVWDLTKYIAGGSGARQNEFDIASSTAITSTGDLSQICPASFAVTGTTASPTAVQVGTFVVDCVVDLLDFIGGLSQSNPARTLFEKRWAERHAYEEQLRQKCAPSVAQFLPSASKHEAQCAEQTASTAQNQAGSQTPAGIGNYFPASSGSFVPSALAVGRR